jgi:hypothetical protein
MAGGARRDRDPPALCLSMSAGLAPWPPHRRDSCRGGAARADTDRAHGDPCRNRYANPNVYPLGASGSGDADRNEHQGRLCHVDTRSVDANLDPQAASHRDTERDPPDLSARRHTYPYAHQHTGDHRLAGRLLCQRDIVRVRSPDTRRSLDRFRLGHGLSRFGHPGRRLFRTLDAFHLLRPGHVPLLCAG